VSSTDSRVQQWESRAEWPLAATAVAFLVAYAWPVLAPGLSPDWKDLCRGVVYVSWALFALDYVAGSSSPNTGRVTRDGTSPTCS
jgi:voltage-gated potassium channel